MSETTNPPPTLAELRARRDEIIALAKRYGATNVRVFGSVARGDATSESDVDLLVDFREGTSLWDVVGLWLDLKALLGCEVNLVGDDDRDTRFRRRIKNDLIAL
ncbi:MAG: nucleotidyltransferase [Chloroflexi bacterium]|nr:MAG: nucleotidyltransferase [Phototrophicales bacterium]RMF78795.1 MAG: nucleotidyltransferase [Chloroflexota bacterium]